MGGPVRRTVTWALHSKFMHGISGVILDENGRILLLKHRFWTDQRWGLPGGLAKYGETVGETLKREMMEEAGLEVRPVKIIEVRTTRGRLAEYVVLAEASGAPKSVSFEIIDARFWAWPEELPPDLLPAHREFMQRMPELLKREGLPVDC
jgi:8-oxo-dGTP diphosphatase